MNNALLIWLLSISVGANFGFAMAFYNAFVRKPDVHIHEIKLEDLELNEEEVKNFVASQNEKILEAIKKQQEGGN